MSDETVLPLPVALLLVDLQPAFLDAIPGGVDALRRAEFAARVAPLLGISVAITEQVPEKLGTTAPSLLEAAPGAPVFAKTAFSALGAEGILDWLRERNVQHILIAGVESTICVYQTAVQAMAESLDVTILTDAVAERRNGDREPALATLRNAGAHILPSETIFYSLLGDATHPQFREFTKLVKAFG
ncbi:MAG: isochorismatase family protein [Puniceicoccales bacterium]